MEIIAHRGFWIDDGERNKFSAFQRAFLCKMGTETDLRDYRGQLKISHDIAGEDCVDAEWLFKLYRDSDCTLALNVKADGLQVLLRELLDRYGMKQYFCFDMSIPDTFGYRDLGLRYFVRESEYETVNALYEKADGVWMDGFEDDAWITVEKISEHLKNGKRVCIVSPELHKREYRDSWGRYACPEILENDGILLCTDYPGKARDFFYGKN